eukprot:878924-Rhodomonas_salina.2
MGDTTGDIVAVIGQGPAAPAGSTIINIDPPVIGDEDDSEDESDEDVSSLPRCLVFFSRSADAGKQERDRCIWNTVLTRWSVCAGGATAESRRAESEDAARAHEAGRAADVEAAEAQGSQGDQAQVGSLVNFAPSVRALVGTSGSSKEVGRNVDGGSGVWR